MCDINEIILKVLKNAILNLTKQQKIVTLKYDVLKLNIDGCNVLIE